MGGGGSKTNSPDIIEKSNVKHEENIYPSLVEIIFDSNNGVSWWSILVIVGCTLLVLIAAKKIYDCYKSHKIGTVQDQSSTEKKDPIEEVEAAIKSSITPIIEQLNTRVSENKKQEDIGKLNF